MIPRSRPAALALALVLATGCGSGDGGSGEGNPGDLPSSGPGGGEAAPTAEGSARLPFMGTWTIESVEGRPVIDRSPAHVSFGADGRVSGDASCNRMTGSYTAQGARLTLAPLGVTRRMCAGEALMEQERRILAALERVTGWQMEDGLLVLTDDEGAELLRGSSRPDSAVTERSAPGD